MFSRKSTAERTAAQAWDYLSSAVAAAGDSAKSAGKQTVKSASKRSSVLADVAGEKSTWLASEAGRRSSELADVAGSRAGAIADEAWARANAAANALAGRRPPLPWALIAGASLLGVALGWLAASTVQAALTRRAENEELEQAEEAITPLPTFDS